MTQHALIAMILFAGVLVASGAIAAPCSMPETTTVQVEVQEAPIAITQDITSADLRTMAARLGRPSVHPVLGFYVGSVGYAVRSMEVQDRQSVSGPMCLGLRLEAALVVVDRRIAIAADLVGSACRLRTTLEHYRHHAAAASLALHRFASEMSATLGPEIDRHIRLRRETSLELRKYVDSLLDDAVERFMTSLAQVQREVDTKSEIGRLSAPCDDT